eukprot:CAMPEP_0194046936 /NCGR_PEP_ID=MMETSP0009_2-20130614/23035_1 /TAXON_ID=210454 /ORGANISM="Grammatophora oceanica, Strain CCMP 410" /LENGTH=67 /DNA_ID=CAMNT_0038692409 /DNA_START=112 /DNA_END=315 /DNA_ORIENTATION=+
MYSLIVFFLGIFLLGSAGWGWKRYWSRVILPSDDGFDRKDQKMLDGEQELTNAKISADASAVPGVVV